MTYIINFDNMKVHTSYRDYEQCQNTCNFFESGFYDISKNGETIYPQTREEFVENGHEENIITREEESAEKDEVLYIIYVEDKQEKIALFQYNGTSYVPLLNNYIKGVRR